MQGQPVPKAFDQNLQPLTWAGSRCCEDVFNQIQNFETRYEFRKRKRKTVDQSIFQQTVYCIVSNLVMAALKGWEEGIRITRSHSKLGKRDRYRTPVLGKKFPDVIDLMEQPEMGFLEQEKAEASTEEKRHQSLIFPTKRIWTRINELDLSVNDFGPGELPEVIILKRKKGDYFDKSGNVPYEDTPDTHRMRSEMTLLNNWLMNMDIQLVSSDYLNKEKIKSIQINNRKLRRYFTRGDSKFNTGGRLFGGFWMKMSKSLRKESMYLNEEEIITLDYQNMAPRILYGFIGAKHDEQDSYIVPGYEKYRSGIKKMFNSMTFTDGPLSRFPKNIKKEFAQNHNIGRVCAAIEHRHTPIAMYLNTEIGHALMKVESDIIVKCMLLCMEQDIPVLPIHDALIFPFDKKHEGTEIMKRVFKEKTGLDGIIKIE